MDLTSVLTDTLSVVVFKNTIQTWLAAVVVVWLVYYAVLCVRAVLSYLLHRNDRVAHFGPIKYLTVLVDSTTKVYAFSWGIFIGSLILKLSDPTMQAVMIIPTVAFFLQLGYWGKKLLDYKVERIIDSKADLQEKLQIQTVVGPFRFIALVVLWSILFLLLLDNIGVDVTALIAGLGVAGVAAALAVQNTLNDLLASLTLAVDKPFVVDDFIVIGDYKGTVEKIGMKTTRIRSLSGEQLIFPNHDLLNSRIQNYKRMSERRIQFGFGILYQTPADKLRQVARMVKEVIEAQEQVRFDRAHFNHFGDSSYDFEVVYFVLNPEYNVYMDCQQAINLGLVERFEAEGIEFAYPTRTLYLQSLPKDSPTSTPPGEPSVL